MSFNPSPRATPNDGSLTDFLGLYNAVTNASSNDIDQDEILALLRGERGHPSHRRALFSDVSWSQLLRFAAAAEIPTRIVYDAYLCARDEVKACNPQIDDAITADRAIGLYV